MHMPLEKWPRHPLTLHGHPLAKTTLGVAFVSEVDPMLGAGFHFAYPVATTLVLNAVPYSENIVDIAHGWFTPTDPPKGWGYAGFVSRRFYKWVRFDLCKSN